MVHKTFLVVIGIALVLATVMPVSAAEPITAGMRYRSVSGEAEALQDYEPQWYGGDSDGDESYDLGNWYYLATAEVHDPDDTHPSASGGGLHDTTMDVGYKTAAFNGSMSTWASAAAGYLIGDHYDWAHGLGDSTYQIDFETTEPGTYDFTGNISDVMFVVDPDHYAEISLYEFGPTTGYLFRYRTEGAYADSGDLEPGSYRFLVEIHSEIGPPSLDIGAGAGFDLDIEVVPEPITAALLTLGSVFVLRRRRA